MIYFHSQSLYASCCQDTRGVQMGYCSFGRLTSIIVPNETNGSHPAIRYSYQPVGYTSVWRYSDWNPSYPFYTDVRTMADGDSTYHRSLYDARGNLCQRFDKRMDGYVLSNQMQRDCFGRHVATLQNILTDLPNDLMIIHVFIL